MAMKSRSKAEGGWGWVCVAAMMVSHLLMTAVLQSFSILYLALRERYHSSATATSWVYSIYVFTSRIAGILAGAAIMKYGSRPCYIVAGLAEALSLVITAYAPSLYVIYLSMGLLLGPGTAVIWTASFDMVSRYFDKRRATATSLVLTGHALGLCFMPYFITWLFHNYGYSGGFLLLAGCHLHNIAIGALLWPPRQGRAEHRGHKLGTVEKLPNEDTAKCTRVASTLKTLDPEDRGASPLLLQSSHTDDTEETREKNICLREASAEETREKIICLREASASGSGASIHYSEDDQITMAMDQGNELNNHSDFTSNEKCFETIKNEDNIRDSNMCMQCGSGLDNMNIISQNAPSGICGSLCRYMKHHLVITCGCHLLTMPAFVLFCLQSLCIYLSFSVFHVYLAAFAKERRISEQHILVGLALWGLIGLVARPAVGFICDLKRIKCFRGHLYGFSALGLGVTVGMYSLVHTTGGYIAICSLFAVFAAVCMTQETMVVGDLVDMTYFANAVGILVTFQGGGFVVGPFVAGALRDTLMTYAPGLYVGAAGGILSFLIFEPYHIYQTLIKPRRYKSDHLR